MSARNPKPCAWTETRKDELVNLLLSGVSQADVGRRFGVSRNSISGIVSRLRAAGRLPRHLPAPKRKAPTRGQQARHVVVPKMTVPAAVAPIATVALSELERGQCRWPHGDPGRPGFGFCGRPARAGLPYCDRHQYEATHVRRRIVVYRHVA